MTSYEIPGLLLIVANVLFSYYGFKDPRFFDRYKFEVDSILVGRDYRRLISSGFLHVGWMHLIFNMISLYAFSDAVTYELGALQFMVVYFAGLIGGDLFALFVHRQHGDYSAVGASGAVSGIIFASIALFPDIEVGLILLPLYVPGWLFGVLYVGVSIYGIKSRRDNIGHEAHLGGALVGMLAALLFYPDAWADNYLTILVITVPTVVFIYLVITRPHILLVENRYFRAHRHNHYDLDHAYNARKARRQKELDRLLDKISRKGMASLTAEEKRKLDEYSK